ncbi:MAG: MOSC N-terminal beta barrel domain-containing protein [Steroidobacteraceae bacterium]
MSATVEVVSLHCYPVKSCRAVDRKVARITNSGLPFDREWMIVDARGGFLTQRTHPQLALITPTVEAAQLVLRCDGQRELRIALGEPGSEREVEIWDARTSALDCGDAAAEWCSEAVGEPVRLVRANPAAPRRADSQYSGTVQAPLRFPDGYPILLIAQESLDALNARLESALPMNRFRPNIVIRGAGPHAEDALREFVAGSLVLRAVKPCTRCRITMTDQLNGRLTGDDEPLRTLKTYRWDATLHGVAFGQNCVVASGAGASLAVADRLVCR